MWIRLVFDLLCSSASHSCPVEKQVDYLKGHRTAAFHQRNSSLTAHEPNVLFFVQQRVWEHIKHVSWKVNEGSVMPRLAHTQTLCIQSFCSHLDWWPCTDTKSQTAAGRSHMEPQRKRDQHRSDPNFQSAMCDSEGSSSCFWPLFSAQTKLNQQPISLFTTLTLERLSLRWRHPPSVGVTESVRSWWTNWGMKTERAKEDA